MVSDKEVVQEWKDKIIERRTQILTVATSELETLDKDGTTKGTKKFVYPKERRNRGFSETWRVQVESRVKSPINKWTSVNG